MEALFAGVAVANDDHAVDWNGRLSGKAADTEVIEDVVRWQIADTAWLYVARDAGGALVTISERDPHDGSGQTSRIR